MKFFELDLNEFVRFENMIINVLIFYWLCKYKYIIVFEMFEV